VNRAEFFAVATEAFFEKPAALRRDQPELYRLLVDFYKLDPGVLREATDEDGLVRPDRSGKGDQRE
jgi:Mlc titration factor MtfA (ptsG expression regulator)